MRRNTAGPTTMCESGTDSVCKFTQKRSAFKPMSSLYPPPARTDLAGDREGERARPAHAHERTRDPLIGHLRLALPNCCRPHRRATGPAGGQPPRARPHRHRCLLRARARRRPPHRARRCPGGVGRKSHTRRGSRHSPPVQRDEHRCGGSQVGEDRSHEPPSTRIVCPARCRFPVVICVIRHKNAQPQRSVGIRHSCFFVGAAGQRNE